MQRYLILMTILVVVAVSAIALSARPADAAPSSSAVAFLTRTLRLLAANQYATVWQTLNPLDQAAAPLDAYVACESKTPIPGTLTSLRVVRRWNEQTVVAPEATPVPSVAVAFLVRLASGGLSAIVRVTAHAVRAGGSWTWILPPSRLRMYRENAC